MGNSSLSRHRIAPSFLLCSLAACILFSVSAAQGQFASWSLLTASDADFDDGLGRRVSIDAGIAALGAPEEDSQGDLSGAVYVFEATAPGSWEEAFKITPDDGAEDLRFGIRVAIDGQTLAVGTWPSLSGAVYIFERTEGTPATWTQVAKLTTPAPNDRFAKSLGLSGDTLVVGAWSASPSGIETGTAYVFERNAGGLGAWGEVTRLESDDAEEFDALGWCSDVSGDTIVVGATGATGFGPGTGAAYVFERNFGGPGAWGQASKLIPNTGSTDGFGTDCAAAEGIALIGDNQDTPYGTASGSASIFEQDQGGPGNWGLAKKFIAPDGFEFDLFGSHVAVNAETAAVYGESSNVYLFARRQNGIDTWIPIGKLDGRNGFGIGLAFSAQEMLLGHPGLNVEGIIEAGGGYVTDIPVFVDDFESNTTNFWSSSTE